MAFEADEMFIKYQELQQQLSDSKQTAAVSLLHSTVYLHRHELGQYTCTCSLPLSLSRSLSPSLPPSPYPPPIFLIMLFESISFIPHRLNLRRNDVP